VPNRESGTKQSVYDVDIVHCDYQWLVGSLTLSYSYIFIVDNVFGLMRLQRIEFGTFLHD